MQIRLIINNNKILAATFISYRNSRDGKTKAVIEFHGIMGNVGRSIFEALPTVWSKNKHILYDGGWLFFPFIKKTLKFDVSFQKVDNKKIYILKSY